MATNLSDIGLGSIQTEADLNDAYAKINAENEQLNAEINTLLYGKSLETPTDISLLNIKPLEVGSEEYKEEANSWSNRLGASVDSVSSMFNEGLGLLADQLGADETAASFRADAAQNLKDRAARPQPEITASITDTAGKISDDIANDQWGDAVDKVGTAFKATAAEAIPSLAPAIGGLAAARALSPFLAAIPIVGVPAAILTNIILTFGSGYLMMSGEGYKRAKELGADETSSKTAGVISGGVGGVLDKFFAGVFLDGLAKTVGRKELTKRIAEQTSKEAAEEIVDKGLKAASIESLRSGLKEAGKLGGIGALTEGAQAANTELAANVAAGKLPELVELSKKVVDEAALGLVGGGGPGAVMGVLAPQSRREAKLKAEELKRTQEELKKETGKEFDSKVVNAATDLDVSDTLDEGSVSTPANNVVKRSISFLKEAASTNPLTAKLYNQLGDYFNNVSILAGDGLKQSADAFNVAVQEQAKEYKLPFTRSIEKNINEGIARILRGQSLNMDKYKGKNGEKQIEIINKLAKNADLDQDGNIIEGTEGPLRKLLNDTRDNLEETGVEIEFITDYLTQSYKIPMTGFGRSKAKRKFVAILKNNKATDPKVRKALALNAEEIVENITSNNGTYTPDVEVNLFDTPQQGEDLSTVKKGFELERTIPPEVVLELDEAGLVNNDAQAIINKYIIGAARRTEIQKLRNNFNDKADQLGLKPVEIERTLEIFQALQNNYKRGFFTQNPFLKKANEFAVTAGYLTTLPFAGIISLSEPILVLSRVSPKHAIWGAIKAGKVSLDKAIRSIRPKYPISDLENSFNSIQQTADLAMTDVIRDIGDTSINRRITDAFFKATFLSQVTQFSRQMASVAVSQQLQEDILLVSDEFKTNKPTAAGNKARKRLNEQGLKNLFSGKRITTKGVKYPKGKKGKEPTEKQLAKYESDLAIQEQEVAGEIDLPIVEQEAIAWAESNINEEQAVAQFKLLGQPITDEVVTQRFGVEGEPPVIIKKALTKTIDEIIMSPNVVNRPLWMSNPNLALVAQLKGFMMVFGNTIGPKVYKEVIKPLMPVHMKREGGIGVNIPTAITRPVETFEGTFKYGLTFVLLLSAMYGTQIMKNAIRYEDADDSPLADLENSELMFKLLQQSNLLGFGNVLISAAESQKYGQSAVSTALGPVAGKIEQLMRALYNLTDRRPRSLANWLAKNTPFTGGLGTERRADVPIVGTDAFEEYLESFLDTVGMAEGGSITDMLPMTEADLNDTYAKINAENEQLNEEINTLLYGESLEASPVPAPVEFAPVLPNVIPEVEADVEDFGYKGSVVDGDVAAPLPPKKTNETKRKAKYGWKDNKVIQKIIKDEPIIGKIIQAESSGNAATPDSPVGARGLMQIMKKTAEEKTGYGVNYNLSYDELFDPVKNVKYGADYFKGLKKSFGNDKDALIAYNWGPGNYKKFLKNGYWIEKRKIFTVPGKDKMTIEIKHYKLPKETRDYVKKILGSSK